MSYFTVLCNLLWNDWCWSWSSSILTIWCEELTPWKRPWWWERLKAREGGNRGWDGWMASLTQWTWVWTSSGRQWRTGKPGMLQFMGLQRVGHELVIQQQITFIIIWQYESESESYSVVSDSLRPHWLCSPWNSTVQDTGVGSLSLLQGIFPTQGSNPGLPPCRRILYQLSHKGIIWQYITYLFEFLIYFEF